MAKMAPTTPAYPHMERGEPPTRHLPGSAGLGIYVHFPWCLKKCPYCDFLSIAVRSADPQRDATRDEAIQRLPHRRYADTVIREFEQRMEHLVLGQSVQPQLSSIFFGGGTPSLWKPEELGRVIRRILLSLDSDEAGSIEVTVECNPTSVDRDHFERLFDAGVNRVSIGVQGLNRERLRFLGRLHDEEEALRAVSLAVGSSIPLVSADLIYGVHRQVPEEAIDEVERIANLGVNHISAYMLTIEENTRFGAMHRSGHLPLLDDALVAASYSAVSERLTCLGFEHYEVSNFCRSGARSVHNEGYWLGRDYLGLGTGAFGTVTLRSGRLRYRNYISPERYMDGFSDCAPGLDPFDTLSTEQETISPEVAIQEALLLGLRRLDGVELAELARARGASDPFAPRQVTIDRLVEQGKLKQEGNRLKIPQGYWLFADQIIRDLL